MKIKQTLVELNTIVNLQKPDYDNLLSNLPSQDKIKFRRDRINRLRIQGYDNKEIAQKVGCCISTIEKDLADIRKRSKKWYETESILDFCQSLQDAIIFCDVTIENLQILYSEYDDLDSKLKILNTISIFEERKTKLYQNTKSVQKYREELRN